MEITNQKEYLKKYLSNNIRDGKKKRKKKPVVSDRVTIIDDDINISQLQTAQEAIDFFNTNEDAPQVVGVIDERPMHLRVKDYRDSDLWKPLGKQTNAVTASDHTKTSIQIQIKKHDSLLQFKQNNKKLNTPVLSVKKRIHSDSASSSPHRQSLKDSSPLRRSHNHADCSPPRNSQKVDRSSPKHELKDSSPPRRSQKYQDSSPPRKNPSKHELRDNSPPRTTHKSTNSSPKRTHKYSNKSPSHQERDKRNSSRKDHSSYSESKVSQLEIVQTKRKMLPGDKRGKYLIPAKRPERMTKTLDGKTAGLQNAQELVQEMQQFQKQEDDLFKNMSAELSGVNASTVIRDRKTGKIRDFAKEEEERKQKEKQDEETKEKYMQWGKGLKQVESYKEKLANDMQEMNKPLARYADDEDLEKYLKERERDEDPMLQYIRKKKKKVDVESSVPSKPQYMGEFMPNRYGIVPGHRWDGVDRSNGYEQKWLETQNAKLAIQEDIYKWSTEDM